MVWRDDTGGADRQRRCRAPTGCSASCSAEAMRACCSRRSSETSSPCARSRQRAMRVNAGKRTRYRETSVSERRSADRRTIKSSDAQSAKGRNVAAIFASIVIPFFPSCRCGVRRGLARGRTPDSQDGRDGRIRTDDPLPPRQMRYQAALRPDVLRVPPLRAGGKYNGGTSPRPPRRRAELSAATAAGLLPAPSAPGG